MKDMIIVGSQGGIGNHLVEAFMSEYTLHATYHVSKGWPAIHEPRELDVRSDQWCTDFAREIEERLGGQVVLVNTFGISIDCIGHKFPAEAWRSVITTNLTGVFNVCRAFLPIMRRKGWGRIINLSSVVGHIGVPGTVAYSASKAGLEGLTRTLAVENAPCNITVNTLVLGYMNTGLIDSVPENERAFLMQRIPARRFGHPDNIVSAIKFLVDADYATGASIVIDGGFLCT